MENQDIKWETWEEQPQENNNQPQVNWGEQSQEENIPTWGEQPQQEEQPQLNWGEQPQEENIPTWGEYENPLQKNNFNKDNNYKQIHSPNQISIASQLYKISLDNSSVIQNILNSNPKHFDNDGRYLIDFEPNNEFKNLINTITKIGEENKLKFQSCFIYKALPNESSSNIFKGKPKNTFIYHLDNNSGDIVFDLSYIGGPALKSHESKEGTLSIMPGWIPYRIGRNNTHQESLLLIGYFD